MNRNPFSQSTLYRQIYADDNLWDAWRSVKANSDQPGLDGVTPQIFERHLLRHLKTLQHRLRARAYKPGRAKLIELPKPDGSKRPIALLSVIDRVAERAVYQALSPIVDPKLHPASHAFRPGRSTLSAIAHLVQLAGADRHWVGHVDIRQCFPSLSHAHLRKQLKRFVKERDVRRLIDAFLAAARRPDQTAPRGVVQGGPLSPMLSNIYLDAFDRRLDELGIPFVRYADNILFLANEKPHLEHALRHIQRALRRIDLQLNPEKTVLTHFRRGVAVIGHLVVEDRGDPRRLFHRALYAPGAEENPDDAQPAAAPQEPLILMPAPDPQPQP